MQWNVDSIKKIKLKNMRGYIHTHKGLFPEINFSKKKNQKLVNCTQNRKQLSVQINQKIESKW